MRFGPALVVGCVLMAASLARGAPTDIWLTATANTHVWPGTSNAPFYVRNAAAMTQLLATNFPCNFHYAAGTYETMGFTFEKTNTANAGCKHYGAGIDQTIIRLVGAQPGQYGIIFGNNADFLTDGFELHDMTLDCNAVHNAVYTNHWGPCEAVDLAGNNLLLSGLKVIGFGTGGTNKECFPVNLSPLNPPANGQTNIQNAVVQNCVFTSAAPSNACGVGCCTVAGVAGWNMINFVISNCCVSNLDVSFPHPQAFYAPLVENCLVDGCTSGWYCEPAYMDEAHRNWIVRSNLFRNVNFGIYIAYAVSNRIHGLTVEGNQFQLRCPPSAAFLTAGPDPPVDEGVDSLVLRNNTIVATNCVDPTTEGFWLARATQAVVQNNRFILPTPRALMLDASSVPARWFLGNIDGNGSPVIVTNRTLGVVMSQAAATVWTNVAPPTTLRVVGGS